MHKSLDQAIHFRRSVRVYTDEAIDPEIVKNCIEKATLAPNSSNMQLWEFYHITSKEKLGEMSKACLGQNAAKTAQQMVVVVVRKDLWRKRQQANIAYLRKQFGQKPKDQYSKREKFALGYYQKLIPTLYSDFLGMLGYTKFIAFTILGLFRPIYRQVRQSDMRIVAHKSAGLAAQTFMLGMAAEELDTCPMEGLDSRLVKKALGLPWGAEINMVIGCGKRAAEGIYSERFRVPFEEVYTEL